MKESTSVTFFFPILPASIMDQQWSVIFQKYFTHAT